jgi:uncharacterized protein (DUF934 family)
MPKLIKDKQLVDDNWALIDTDASLETVLTMSASQLLLPAYFWAENKAALSSLGAEIAIWFDSSQNPALFQESTQESFEQFPLIALEFPVFKDGRAFSYAALLRKQFNYQGEIRAIGEVLRDQLTYMLRCGFTSFLIADDAEEEVYLNGFNDFSEHYQSTVINPVPLFRRRV